MADTTQTDITVDQHQGLDKGKKLGNRAAPSRRYSAVGIHRLAAWPVEGSAKRSDQISIVNSITLSTVKTVRPENAGTVFGDYYIARFTNTPPGSICSRISEISSTVGARNSETSGATSSSNPVAAWILAKRHFDHRIQFMCAKKISGGSNAEFCLLFLAWTGDGVVYPQGDRQTDKERQKHAGKHQSFKGLERLVEIHRDSCWRQRSSQARG